MVINESMRLSTTSGKDSKDSKLISKQHGKRMEIGILVEVYRSNQQTKPRNYEWKFRRIDNSIDKRPSFINDSL